MDNKDKKNEPDKKFVPYKTPRYLPGQVEKAILDKDLKEYNEHRLKIYTAKHKIDCEPPRVRASSLLKLDKLNKDLYALKNINAQNMKLMMKINTINRLHGLTECYNPKANFHTTKWPAYEDKMKKIQKENALFYKRILEKTCTYSTKTLNKQWKNNYKLMCEQARFPFNIKGEKSLDESLLERKSISEIPFPISNAVVLRPRIYMEFSVQGYLPLGKIIFELYRDVVPNSVDTFLNRIDGLDRCKTLANESFYKIIPQEYCEIGDHPRNIKKDRSIFSRSFPQENFILQHSRPGVVSLVPTGDETNNIQFSITFEEYPAFNGVRVAIGKMIHGYKNLLKIQDFGKKVGKPRYRVFIKNCGIIGGRKMK